MNKMLYYPFERSSALVEFQEFNYDKLLEKVRNIFNYLEMTGKVKIKNVYFDFTPRRLKYHYLFFSDLFTIKVEFLLNDKGKDIDKTFSIFMPKMTNRKFKINGYDIVPVFQIIDSSIIARPGSILVRSMFNSVTIVYNSTRAKVFLLKKSVPLSVFFFAIWGFKETCKRFGVELEEKDGLFSGKQSNVMVYKHNKEVKSIKIKNLDKLDELGQMIFKTACDTNYKKLSFEFGTEEYFLEMLGSYYTKHNMYDKALDLLKTFESTLFDPLTSKNIKYNGNFADFLEMLFREYKTDNPLDVLDLSRRKIRLDDYLLYPLFEKVFSIIRISLRYPKRTHHIKISNDEVLKSLNKQSLQPLVQFDMSINPIGEVLNFFKCSVYGVDGLTKDQISLAMRNVHPSYYGTLCPIDTPDGPNCGVVTALTPTAQIDLETGKIDVDKEMKTRDIVSLSVALSPFTEKNDGVRLQMGANQMEQSLPLIEAELPLVRTGAENLVAKLSSYTKKSPVDGEVIDINKFYIVIKDNEDKIYFVDIKPEFSSLNVFKFFKPCVEIGTIVKKNQIIAHTDNIKDEQVAFGRNLKTAFYCIDGFTYEDAIVISETAAKKLSYYKTNHVLIHLDKNEVLLKHNDKFLPEIGEKVEDGILAKKITLKNKPEFLLDYDYYIKDIVIPKGSEILDIKIYVNDESKADLEFNQFILELEKKQIAEEKAELNVIKKYVTDKKELDVYRKKILKSVKRGKFYTNHHFEGITIFVYYRELRKTEIGDKLANRAGNKGVVSLVLPDEKMPKDENGEIIHVCLNPMGLITRMNPGQLYEMAISAVCKKIGDMIKEKKQKRALKLILDFINMVDNTKDKKVFKKTKEFVDSLSQQEIENLLKEIEENGLQIFQPPFESITPETYVNVLNKFDLKEKQHLIYNGKRTTKPVTVGYMYIMKLVHTAEGKIHSRAVGPYSQLTGQPLRGKRNKGAQRIGEMEIWAFAAHEATSNIKEILTIKSDDVKGRKKMLRHFIDATPIPLPNDDSSLARKIFEAYIKSLMLEVKNDG